MGIKYENECEYYLNINIDMKINNININTHPTFIFTTLFLK